MEGGGGSSLPSQRNQHSRSPLGAFGFLQAPSPLLCDPRFADTSYGGTLLAREGTPLRKIKNITFSPAKFSRWLVSRESPQV